MKVTFCGHRKIEDFANVKKWLIRVVSDLIKEGANEFYLGGYGEFDKLAAKIIKELTCNHTQIKTILVLPYIDKKIDKYDMNYYTQTEYPPLESVPKRYAILKSNEYMVENCDVLVSYVVYTFGGACKTLEYAKRKNKQIIQYK